MLVELFRFGILASLWVAGMWVAGACLAAWVAGAKGREPVAWFLIAFFLSPPIALIALNAVPDLPGARPATIAERAPGGDLVPVGDGY